MPCSLTHSMRREWAEEARLLNQEDHRPSPQTRQDQRGERRRIVEGDADAQPDQIHQWGVKWMKRIGAGMVFCFGVFACLGVDEGEEWESRFEIVRLDGASFYAPMSTTFVCLFVSLLALVSDASLGCDCAAGLRLQTRRRSLRTQGTPLIARLSFFISFCTFSSIDRTKED
jgi:hypothetical protein